MTVLVGVLCSDGVVIGSDSIATSAAGVHPLLNIQSNSKIEIFESSVIVAATGAVGLSQRLSYHVELAVQGGVFRNLNRNDASGNVSTRFLQDCAKTLVQHNSQHGIQFGALLAAVVKGKPCLIEYDGVGFQPEAKEGNLFFVSMGSGQILADPFLAFVKRVLWNNALPTVEDAKFGVYWVLEHTIKLAPGGVGRPIRMASLSQVNGKWVAAKLESDAGAAEYIAELEDYIGKFPQSKIDSASASTPPLPPLPT